MRIYQLYYTNVFPPLQGEGQGGVVSLEGQGGVIGDKGRAREGS